MEDILLALECCSIVTLHSIESVTHTADVIRRVNGPIRNQYVKVRNYFNINTQIKSFNLTYLTLPFKGNALIALWCSSYAIIV